MGRRIDVQRLFRSEPCDCPQCGARCREHESHCWFCQHDLAVPASPPMQARQFSLAMMLLAMTLLGACLALFRLSPGLGSFAALTIVPAAWRTMQVVRAEAKHRRKLRGRELIYSFLGSVVIGWIALICAAVAFCVVCLAALPVLLLANWLSGVDFAGLEFVVVVAAAGAAAFTLIAFHWQFRPE